MDITTALCLIFFLAVAVHTTVTGHENNADRRSLNDELDQLKREVADLRTDVDVLKENAPTSSSQAEVGTNVVGNSDDSTAGNFVYGTCKPMPNSALSEQLFQPITGEISLKQNASGGPLEIDIFMYGFRSELGSLHGFHVHTYGDLRDGCESTGSHYNPLHKQHGAPDAAERHVGDWGNVRPNKSGVVSTKLVDNLANLVGPYSIIGRAIVVHADADDLGLGGFSDSLTTGHAGTRLACCVIGIADH